MTAGSSKVTNMPALNDAIDTPPQVQKYIHSCRISFFQWNKICVHLWEYNDIASKFDLIVLSIIKPKSSHKL